MKSFREKVAYLDGSYFLLIYEGTPLDLSEDDYHEVERKLRLFMDNKEVHSDIIKNVSFLRTIFVDYDEQYLYVKYHDKTKDEYVEYKNKELTLYECKDLDTDKKKKNKSTKNSFKTRTDTYNQLKNIGPIGIGKDEYKIIDVYNYFFNMCPNFSYKQINIIIQCMILILKKYNINILDNNDYIMDEELGIPISPSLNERISGLFPYGIIRSKSNEKLLSNEEIEKISLIGNQVSNAIHGTDRLQNLVKITKSLCDGNEEIIDLEGTSKKLIKE